jgi:hypothetical protein
MHVSEQIRDRNRAHIQMVSSHSETELWWPKMARVEQACKRGVYSPTFPLGNVVQHVCISGGTSPVIFRVLSHRRRVRQSNDTPSYLEGDRILEVPSHHHHSHSLIRSFVTKPSGPHYLPSLSPSFVSSATPWGSEWMKHLRTALGLTPTQDQVVRMSRWAGKAW